MLTAEEIGVVQRFVQDFQLEEQANWAFFCDLFLMVEHAECETYFREHHADHPGVREIFQTLLAENELLASRFASLKHWHGASRPRLAVDRRQEEKVRLGTISAISNFADTFLGIIRQL